MQEKNSLQNQHSRSQWSTHNGLQSSISGGGNNAGPSQVRAMRSQTINMWHQPPKMAGTVYKLNANKNFVINDWLNKTLTKVHLSKSFLIWKKL